ncbi:hypothetical protein [Actinotalea sp. K2]|uniref:hypothetical protein n=1 Tax=Actinotalea sp. K2 TaxID=2939438 RepID=UPI00201765A3|nr:hypothetical protein [Actinotalea sp. K2]MCL3862597.1 hypothetical protein [Actinotalea sp. K2]
MGRSTSRRRRSVLRGVLGTTLLVAVTGVGALGVAGLLGRLDSPAPVVRCAAALDGTDWYLATDQADTAALLVATSVRREMPARAATIAIATGLQESKLRNIDYGDRDSVGIFQQRPSQGWGTVEQIMDPVYSTNAFFDGLARVEGYQDLPVTEAAQAVQRSGFPDAYAQHETRSRAWASALTGNSTAAVSCTLREPGGPGDPAALLARAERDFGALTGAVGQDGAVLLDHSALAGAQDDVDRLGWAVSQWAVAVASPLEVVEVEHAGQVWTRDSAGWSVSDREGPPTGQVRVVLAG